eukprot:TRINITY_DN27568_c0_g1_i1.p1 TRINITY_DN27568_c0_g1~~TRINITY_DN27568_c0_g1_i1.p1  ORF type:complete len:823 (+),score=127.71 TRINITY_DN27568_c0_g1_i1:174-2471(+)
MERTCDGSSTDMLFTGLCNFSWYRFSICAHNSSGSGPWSQNSSEVRTKAGVPQPPLHLECLESKRHELCIGWAPPFNDGGACITSFNIRAQCVNSTSLTTIEVSAPGPPAWLTSLEGNRLYTVSIAAVNATGSSVFSSPMQVKTAPNPPMPPTQLEVVDSRAESTILRWAPPLDDGGSPILRYRIRAVPPAPHSPIDMLVQEGLANADVSDAEDLNGQGTRLPLLQGVTEYEITVWSQSVAGESAEGARVMALTGATVPAAPPAPPRLAKEPGQTKLKIRWDSPTDDGGSSITEFEVLVALPESSGSTSPPEQRLHVNACEVTIEGLEVCRSYRFAVRAKNLRGWGPSTSWSPTIKTAPSAPGPPAAPRMEERTARSLAVEWDMPESDAPVIEYEVWCGRCEEETARDSNLPPSDGRRTRTARTHIKVTGLAPTTRYVFRVRALNASGWSPWSQTSEGLFTSDVYSLDEIKGAVMHHFGGTVASAFKSFDRDSDGFVSREEFCNGGGFEAAGLSGLVPKEQRLRLFEAADESLSGHLTYRDFARLFSPYRATPGLMRQELPELSGEQREELREEITGQARVPNSRVENAVRRLTTPRPVRLRRSASELSLETPSPSLASRCSRSERLSSSGLAPGRNAEERTVRRVRSAEASIGLLSEGSSFNSSRAGTPIPPVAEMVDEVVIMVSGRADRPHGQGMVQPLQVVEAVPSSPQRPVAPPPPEPPPVQLAGPHRSLPQRPSVVLQHHIGPRSRLTIPNHSVLTTSMR